MRSSSNAEVVPQNAGQAAYGNSRKKDNGQNKAGVCPIYVYQLEAMHLFDVMNEKRAQIVEMAHLLLSVCLACNRLWRLTPAESAGVLPC